MVFEGQPIPPPTGTGETLTPWRRTEPSSPVGRDPTDQVRLQPGLGTILKAGANIDKQSPITTLARFVEGPPSWTTQAAQVPRLNLLTVPRTKFVRGTLCMYSS